MATYDAKVNEVLKSKIRETRVKIDILDWNSERKIDSLEGDVISGNISIDGNSALRRTVNLTVAVTDEENNYIGEYNKVTGSMQKNHIIDNYHLTNPANKLSVNKKVKIFIGTKDLMKEYSNVQTDTLKWYREQDSDYVWYNLGIYVITKPTIVASNSSRQITLVLQDKGCLHNGTVSGILDRATRFDAQTIDNSSVNGSIATSISEFSKEYNLVSFSNKATTIPILKKMINSEAPYTEQDLWTIDEALTYSVLTGLTTLEATTDDTSYNKQKTKCDVTISDYFAESHVSKLSIYEIIYYAATTFGGEAPGRVIISDVPDYIKCPVTIRSGTGLQMMDGSRKIFEKDTVGYKMIKYTYPTTLTIAAGQPISKVYESCNSALGGNYQYYYDVNGYFHFEEIKNYKYNRTPKVEDIQQSDYLKKYNQSAVEVDFSNDATNTSYNNAIDYTNIKNDINLSNTVDGTYIGYHIVIDSRPTEKGYVVAEDGTYEEMDYREFIVHDYDTGTYNFVAKAKTKAALLAFFKDHADLYSNNLLTPCGYISGNDAGYYLYQNGALTEYPISIIHSKELPSYYEELSTIWKNEYYDSDWNRVIKEKYNYNFDILDANSSLRQFSISNIGRRTYQKTDSSIKSLMPTYCTDYFLVTDTIKRKAEDTTYKKYWFDAAHTCDISSSTTGGTLVVERIYPAVFDQTVNGVHIVSDGKGNVTVKGTATATIGLYLSSYVPEYHIGGVFEKHWNGTHPYVDFYTASGKEFVVALQIETTLNADNYNVGWVGFAIHIDSGEVTDFTTSNVYMTYTYTLYNQKQILPVTTAYNKTVNGVTVASNGYGGYTVKGTATDNCFFNIYEKAQTDDYSNLILNSFDKTGKENSVEDNDYMVWITLYKDSTWVHDVNMRGVAKFSDYNANELETTIFVRSGKTVDDAVYPRVTLYSDLISKGYTDELNYPNYGNIYNDAFTAVKQLLFNKTTYNSKVTLISIPYYWLDVNNRAYIYYQQAAIQGFYLINKISYNIDATSLMTVSMTEAQVLEE